MTTRARKRHGEEAIRALKAIARAKLATADRLREMAGDALASIKPTGFDRYLAKRRKDPKFEREFRKAKSRAGRRK